MEQPSMRTMLRYHIQWQDHQSSGKIHQTAYKSFDPACGHDAGSKITSFEEYFLAYHDNSHTLCGETTSFWIVTVMIGDLC